MASNNKEYLFLFFIFLTNYLLVQLNAQIDNNIQLLNVTNLTEEQVFRIKEEKSDEESKSNDLSITTTTSSTSSLLSLNLSPQPPQSPPSFSSSQPNSQSSIPLNKTHAVHFKSWLDNKSNELYELSMNFSGFKLLNETYNTHLRKDAKFAWINFTSMIINISSTISEVLYNKTLIVKNLSDFVERTYDEYKNETEKVKESINFVYYDSKSPKTFCDVAENYKLKLAEKNSKQKKGSTTTAAAATTTTTTATSTNTASGLSTTAKLSKKAKRSNDDNNEQLAKVLVDEEVQWHDNRVISPHRHHNPLHDHEIVPDRHHKRSGAQTPAKNLTITTKQATTKKRPVKPLITKKTTKPTTTTTTTPTPPPLIDLLDESEAQIYEEEEEDAPNDFELFEGDYWDVPCMNRSFDENFKTAKNISTFVNRNYSTLQVPINVYKQEMIINMTAYWTEKLNEQFKKNYDLDNELFWQYFCSSLGLFRRYPGAYWSVPPREDFFDCRLQSWYIMAAASPKDVLFLLDTSGSMLGLRLEIAKKLIEFILDTLTDNDYFNIITFANSYQFLFVNETDYSENFIQASKANKLKFKEELQALKNPSQMASLKGPLTKAFGLFNDSKLARSGCNKVIMIITDGHYDNVDEVFREYNSEKTVRVFSFKIGRDMENPAKIRKLACDNNGEYYHVVTLTDINEHVYEYIPVLSRSMALMGVHETTWSNVFIGYLDKELKIAVARPAFVNKTSLLAKLKPKKILRPKQPKNSTLHFFPAYSNISLLDNFTNQSLNYDLVEIGDEGNDMAEYDYLLEDDDEENNNEKMLKKASWLLKKQPVLLGVVGVDVPVLRLISKVSPKFQMGVGIYIIMMDNNGFLVFHPSIKRELTKGDFDSKGTSQSIDLDKFEIPINNDEEFEDLEHEMIDQKTNNKTLMNWKREGLRVIKRRTEYVYTPVNNTPFSVAIASPSSFGRYYIELPVEKEKEYERVISNILNPNNPDKRKFETLIQLYNCSYSYQLLSLRLTMSSLNSKQNLDFCLRYLLQDSDQVLAIKSDLMLHNIFYNSFNYSIFTAYPNLAKSTFYGTYSGITFYLPVTLFKNKTVDSSGNNDNPGTSSTGGSSGSTSSANLNSTEPTTTSTTTTSTTSTTTTTTTTQSLDQDELPEKEVVLEAYNMSANLFSTESSKHTYSFEKQYYTRAVEFSDYLRASYNSLEPVFIYFLNETTSKESRSDTVSAAIPLWLDKVPASVSGVVYDGQKLQDILFTTAQTCEQDSCVNLCNSPELSVTCYLVDEHGIVIMSNGGQNNNSMSGQPLYKVNPWLMLQLEFDGLYDLIVTGNKLQDCNKPPIIFNSATRLFNVINFLIKHLFSVLKRLFVRLNSFLSGGVYLEMSSWLTCLDAQSASASKQAAPEVNQNDWRIRNSHCFYFGIYSFNITKWKEWDASELRVWCNNTNEPKHYLAGYLKHSNLLMLIVEDEDEVSKCGNINSMSQRRPESWNERELEKSQLRNIEDSLNGNDSNKSEKVNYTINRYRKKPNYCHNYFPNESLIFTCANSAPNSRKIHFFLITIYLIIIVLFN